MMQKGGGDSCPGEGPLPFHEFWLCARVFGWSYPHYLATPDDVVDWCLYYEDIARQIENAAIKDAASK